MADRSDRLQVVGVSGQPMTGTISNIMQSKMITAAQMSKMYQKADDDEYVPDADNVNVSIDDKSEQFLESRYSIHNFKLVINHDSNDENEYAANGAEISQRMLKGILKDKSQIKETSKAPKSVRYIYDDTEKQNNFSQAPTNKYPSYVSDNQRKKYAVNSPIIIEEQTSISQGLQQPINTAYQNKPEMIDKIIETDFDDPDITCCNCASQK